MQIRNIDRFKILKVFSSSLQPTKTYLRLLIFHLKNRTYFIILSFCFLQKLKFNQSLQEVTKKYLGDDALKNLIELVCRTNKLASFIWLDWYYHRDDIFNPLIYASCEELYAANKCRNIPKTINWVIYPSPTESKSSLKSRLRHYVNVPKTGGCIGCFASSGNETIRSFTKYYFKGNLSFLM